ncbi:MAG: hypothetical protein QME60_03325 [Verrucomicrobiota bacterium]|nr:hypothetical protein [Verrucomicrobiota bacterium]
MKYPDIIQVLDSTSCPFAVSAEDGQRAFDRIALLLREGKHVAP